MNKNNGGITFGAVIDYLASLAQDKEEDVSFLQLYLTQKCQLRCSYCRMGALENGPDMSEETIHKAVDLLMTSKGRDIKLQFFGGEPLLRFDLIKKTVSYTLRKNTRMKKNIEFLVATNGALLEGQHFDFFKKHDFALVFSMDGKAELQKANRPPAQKKDEQKVYLKTEKNLEILADSGIRYFVNAVIAPHTISKIGETVKFFIQKGARHIRLSYMMGVFWTKADIDRLKAEVKKTFLECQRHHPEVEIRACKDEPVIVSSGLAVTPGRDLYVGTTLPLMHRLPHLGYINHYGHLDSLKDIKTIKRNRSSEVQNALKRMLPFAREFELLANNIHLGLVYEKLFETLTGATKSN